jgi:hypothetical protein
LEASLGRGPLRASASEIVVDRGARVAAVKKKFPKGKKRKKCIKRARRLPI